MRTNTWIILLATAAIACGSSGSDDEGTGGGGGTTSSGTGGSTSSGTGGSTSSGTGGTTSSGTGGSTSSGTGGSGVNPRCDPLCDAFANSGCAEAPTLDGCLLTCKALTSADTCDASADDYFDCVEAGDVQCNAADEPYVLGCGDEWLIAIGCAVNENPNPDIVAPCDSYCDSIVAAGCANNGTKDECTTNCLWLGATGTGCDGEWGDFLTCANAANFICIAGYAVAQGCGTEWQTYRTCIDDAGGG